MYDSKGHYDEKVKNILSILKFCSEPWSINKFNFQNKSRLMSLSMFHFSRMTLKQFSLWKSPYEKKCITKPEWLVKGKDIPPS